MPAEKLKAMNGDINIVTLRNESKVEDFAVVSSCGDRTPIEKSPQNNAGRSTFKQTCMKINESFSNAIEIASRN